VTKIKSDNIDDQITYHREMEQIANIAGDFIRADHHRKMEEIFKALKEKQRS
jgi:hypothetical protein